MKKFLQQKPLSTFDERLKKTPKDNPLRGYWTGKRGLSTYIPTSSQTEILEILHHYNLRVFAILKQCRFLKNAANAQFKVIT